jgi:fused signal recognition particle receptor
VLIVGVNGTGKTTTVGKLAQLLKSSWQAAACGRRRYVPRGCVEQLEMYWANRAGVDLIRARAGADPAAVVLSTASRRGKAKGAIPFFDTAGRLHTEGELDERAGQDSAAIARARVTGAPHEVLLVLDATVGQNGLSQAREFMNVAGVNGVVLTKLDGTAKGGIAVAIAEELKLPIRYVGVGESIDDLIPFDVDEYVEALFEVKW